MTKNLTTDRTKAVIEASTQELLDEIIERGGHPAAVCKAVMLCIQKSQDYNHSKTLDVHTVDRSNYFPFGAVSYAQMIHTKAQRFNSLVQKQLDGKESNFEGLEDTALDLINYAGFYIDSTSKRTA